MSTTVLSAKSLKAIADDASSRVTGGLAGHAGYRFSPQGRAHLQEFATRVATVVTEGAATIKMTVGKTTTLGPKEVTSAIKVLMPSMASDILGADVKKCAGVLYLSRLTNNVVKPVAGKVMGVDKVRVPAASAVLIQKAVLVSCTKFSQELMERVFTPGKGTGARKTAVFVPEDAYVEAVQSDVMSVWSGAAESSTV